MDFIYTPEAELINSYDIKWEDKLSQASDNGLLTWWANTSETYSAALGHGKAERNSRLLASYEKEMKRRGIAKPDDDFIREHGRFNGTGST